MAGCMEASVGSKALQADSRQRQVEQRFVVEGQRQPVVGTWASVVPQPWSAERNHLVEMAQRRGNMHPLLAIDPEPFRP